MTASIFFGEMLIAPLLAMFLLAISPLKMTSVFEVFIAGVVVWTFAEYVFHRFVFHKLVAREHRLHHAAPDDPKRSTTYRRFCSKWLDAHLRPPISTSFHMMVIREGSTASLIRVGLGCARHQSANSTKQSVRSNCCDHRCTRSPGNFGTTIPLGRFSSAISKRPRPEPRSRQQGNNHYTLA
jgi:hypothetical protein